MHRHPVAGAFVRGTVLSTALLAPAAAVAIQALASNRPVVEAPAAPTRGFDVDASACRGMYEVLTAMRRGAAKDEVSATLDALLATRPYRAMFEHYNRDWRPDHLPEGTFRRMILSLQFPVEYTAGENERADAMRGRWTKFYPDLAAYEKLLRQLESTDLRARIEEGVAYAQGWLPPGWSIPAFYLPVIPNGGSPAFTIGGTQGYDLLQLAEASSGEIDLERFVSTVTHESHHLGMRTSMPEGLSEAERVAFRVLTLTIAEGAATAFATGPPAGRVPQLPGLRFRTMRGELESAWNAHVAVEEEILQRQVTLLTKALAGELTDAELDRELRDYWLAGLVGPAYVLGAEMFGAIHLAHGKEGVFAAMTDPRRLFELYDAALDAKPVELARCPRVPRVAVAMALGIGQH